MFGAPRPTRELEARTDDGFTLIENLITIGIVVIGLLALLSVIVNVIHQQAAQRQQAQALRLANGTLDAASQETTSSALWAQLVAAAGSTASNAQVVNGTTYRETETSQLCSAADSSSSCTTPGSGDVPVVRVAVTVSWSAGGSSHSITVTRTLAQTFANILTAGTADLADGSPGTGGLSASVGTLSLSPSQVTLTGSDHPSQPVTATLTMLSPTTATSVTLSWTDESGAHQTTMTGTGSAFTVTIPASSITAVAADQVDFTAKLPGARAVPTATLRFSGSSSATPSSTPTPTPSATSSASPTSSPTPSSTSTPITASCSVSQSGLVSFTATYTCTATGLSATDSVVATNTLGLGSVRLTSANGSTWSATQSNTLSLLNATVTFTLTRNSDGATYKQTYVLGH